MARLLLRQVAIQSVFYKVFFIKYLKKILGGLNKTVQKAMQGDLQSLKS